MLIAIAIAGETQGIQISEIVGDVHTEWRCFLGKEARREPEEIFKEYGYSA